MIMKMHTFRKIVIDYEDFVSGMSSVSVYIDFKQS